MTLASRLITFLVFFTVSWGLWHLLDGFTYRLIIAAIPILLAVQMTLSDLLESTLTRRIGYKTRWFTLLIAPGTILHEICHLLTALATGCTVTKAALFRPNPKTGVLGYVAYTQPTDKWVVLREFAVSFAPFFGCGLTLLALNTITGGGLLSAINSQPITNTDQIITYAQGLLQSLASATSTLDYSKPATLILIYLQLCFTAGAAPSGTDFRGAFTSLYKHIISAIIFIGLAALAVLLSQSYFHIAGYEGQIASAAGLILNFTATITLLTILLMIPLIAIAYTGSRITEIEGIAKTIPITSALLAYYLLKEHYTTTNSLLISAATLVATAIALILTNPKKNPKNRNQPR